MAVTTFGVVEQSPHLACLTSPFSQVTLSSSETGSGPSSRCHFPTLPLPLPTVPSSPSLLRCLLFSVIVLALGATHRVVVFNPAALFWGLFLAHSRKTLCRGCSVILHLLTSLSPHGPVVPTGELLDSAKEVMSAAQGAQRKDSCVRFLPLWQNCFG